jgi:CubicO group peptidase (beta-lactamase class C family)
MTLRSTSGFALGLLLLAPAIARADVPSNGKAFAALEDDVDALVEDLMNAKKLPGVTVAVTKQGRLILAKGYGLADIKSKTEMQRDTRVRIGSVTKATVTGPAGFQLMKSKGIDPKKTKLYGPGGVLFQYDVETYVGARRHNPIIDVAIAPDDKVYAFYSDGTRSVGTTSDLDKHEKPVKFSLPPGKTVLDVQAVAIAKNSRVYWWYDDATLSIGTSTDADAHRAPGKPGEVKVPGGKSMDHLVGAAIAKSNDHVILWWEDGTTSSGTSTDLGHYYSPKKFTTGWPSGTPYEIVGTGIAKDDRVYAWFNHTGTSKQFVVTSGTSTDLDHYKEAYAYSIPPTGAPDWRQWFTEITIQHLLDHRAGFSRDGDQTGARAMFKVSEADLRYEHIHRHFLRSKKLLFRPGTGYSYSNHGFGLWTLLIEEMSGKSYPSYARDNYLKPMGLDDDVLPRAVPRRAKDAAGYVFVKDKLQAVPDIESGLGLAAGGWIASGESLVKIMSQLETKYTEAQLDDMGWGKEARSDGKGKLSHNGGLEGGTAYVVMYPKGYVSNSGKKLGRVHVAIATNVSTDAGALEDLASKIALEVPDANIPETFDLWK